MKSKSFFVLTDTAVMPPKDGDQHELDEAQAFFGKSAYINEDGNLVYTIVSSIHTNPDRVIEILDLQARFAAGKLTPEEQDRWDAMARSLPPGATTVAFDSAVQELQDYAEVEKILQGVEIHQTFMPMIKDLLEEDGEVTITTAWALSKLLRSMSNLRGDDGDDPDTYGGF